MSNSTTRVSFTTEALMSMKNNAYMDRDLRVIEKIFLDALETMSEEEKERLDRAGQKDSNIRGQRFVVSIGAEPDKYEAAVKDANGVETGEKVLKDVTRIRVWVNFGYPEGACISFNPSSFRNKLTMGTMSLLMKDISTGKFIKDEDGKAVVTRGLSDIKAMLEGQDTSNPVVNAFYKALDMLGGISEIKEMPLRSTKDWEPYYVERETQNILDGKNEYMPQEVVDKFQTYVEKMEVLAKQIAEKAPALKTTKKKESGETYEATSKLRILVEKRMGYVKDAQGNKVIDPTTKKAKVAVVKDDNGNIIYDAKMNIAVGSCVVNFNIDVTEEQAKIKWVDVTEWVGNKGTTIAQGIGDVDKKCNDEIKAYVKAIKDAELFVPFEHKETENSKLWDVMTGLNDTFKKEAPDYLDENGNKVYTEKGNVKKEVYATYDKDYNCVEISFRYEPHTKVRIYEGEDGTLRASYHMLSSEKGGTAPHASLTAKNLDGLVSSEVVKKALQETLPQLQGKAQDSVEHDS